jgi:TetR/AcrR family transcriptional regulator, repressor for neighboring sulfatase
VARSKPKREPATRRRRSADEARAEILAVAERQLAASGPAAIRLQAIADELGVTHPAILRHFRSREELLYTLLRHAGRRLRDALSAAVERAGEHALDEETFFAALDRIYRD